jgi:hypothetical protein
MSESHESTAPERAAAGASRKAYVEQNGSYPGDIEQRSLGDVANNPVFLTAASTAVSIAAPYVVEGIQNVVKRPPGKHEQPPTED